MAIGTIYPDPAPAPIQDLSERVATLEEGGEGATTVTAANITDATATGRSVLTAANAAAARTAIGAGAPYTLPNATSSVRGGVLQTAGSHTAAVAAVGTDVETLATELNALITKYNALLAALKTSGVVNN